MIAQLVEPVRVALITKAFAHHNNDYSMPPLIDLVRSLTRQIAVDVYALDYPYERRSYDLFGARVFAFGFGRFVGPIQRRGLFQCLTDAHKKDPYDLLHAVWADRPAMLASRLSAKLGLPMVTSFYAGEAAWLPEINYGSLRHQRAKRQLASVMRRSSAVTAGSRSLANTIEGLFQSPVAAVPLGYDPQRFQVEGPSEPLGPGTHIVTAASFGPVKGLDIALEALAHISRSQPRLLDGVTWHLIGPNTRHHALRQDLSNKVGKLPVVLHSARPHWEMAPLYRAADLGLVSSRFESQCLAAIELAACGTPVMGTAVGILPELATPDWVCPAGDHVALADVIARVLAQPAQWKEQSRRQQDWLARNATLDIARNGFLDVYRSAMQTGAPL